MLKNIISQGNYAIWSQIALTLFFLTFVVILFWVFRKHSGSHYQYMSNLPNQKEIPGHGENNE